MSQQRSGFKDLPTELTTILVFAMLGVVVVTACALALSFAAIDGVARNGMGWGRIAFLLPVCIDGLLLACELATVGAALVSRTGYTIFFGTIMLVFAGLSVWVNAMRVPADHRLIAATPPLAAVFGTVVIAALGKILWQAFGKATTYRLPQARSQDVGPGYVEMSRLPDGAYGVLLEGETIRTDTQLQAPLMTLPENGHNGQPRKGPAVEEYVRDLATKVDLKAVSARGVAAQLGVTERTVGPILKRHREAQQRRNGNR